MTDTLVSRTLRQWGTEPAQLADAEQDPKQNTCHCCCESAHKKMGPTSSVSLRFPLPLLLLLLLASGPAAAGRRQWRAHRK